MPPKRSSMGQADPAAAGSGGPVTEAGSGAAGGGGEAGHGRGYGGAENDQIMQILASIPRDGATPDKTVDNGEHGEYSKTYRPNINVPVSDSPRGGVPARSPRSNANVFLRSPPPVSGAGPPTSPQVHDHPGGSISTGYQSPGTLALAGSASAWPSIPAASGSNALSTPRRTGPMRTTRASVSQSPMLDVDRSPDDDDGEDEMADENWDHSGDDDGDSPAPKGKPKGGARKGQPKPRLDKSTDAWKQTRKDQHKEVERRRRETINDGILELKKIVPGTEKNKGEILRQAVKYIQHLKDAEASNIEKWTLEKLLTDQALHEQADRAAALEREVGELRALVRRLGGNESEVKAAPAIGTTSTVPSASTGQRGEAEGEANGVQIEPGLAGGKRPREDGIGPAGADKRVRVAP